MPRTSVAVSAGMQGYPTLPIPVNSADLALTVADLTNLNQIPFNGSMLIVTVQNVNAGAQTVTFTSAPDGLNRTGDIAAYTMQAGELAQFIFQRQGWRQADGMLYCQGSHADVKFGAVSLS